jgi:hypothetical protein
MFGVKWLYEGVRKSALVLQVLATVTLMAGFFFLGDSHTGRLTPLNIQPEIFQCGALPPGGEPR